MKTSFLSVNREQGVFLSSYMWLGTWIRLVARWVKGPCRLVEKPNMQPLDCATALPTLDRCQLLQESLDTNQMWMPRTAVIHHSRCVVELIMKIMFGVNGKKIRQINAIVPLYPSSSHCVPVFVCALALFGLGSPLCCVLFMIIKCYVYRAWEVRVVVCLSFESIA